MARDQRAGRRHADEDRALPAADRGARLLAQRGVRLVADHDRVGVGDVAGVAHEPLVGLDGHRAVGAVLVAQQRRRDAVRVAAVAQLAEELVDEVAAVGEDQDAAGARGLDEAERRDGLAGAGRVLEPEAPGRARVLRLLGKLLLVLVADARSRVRSRPSPRRRPRRPRPPRRARRRRQLVVARRRGSSSSSTSSSVLVDSASASAPLPFWRSASAISAVSVPDSASTWWADSTVPSASFGSSSAEQPLEPEHQRVLAGATRRSAPRGPASISASAASNARRRAVPGSARRGRARTARA